jgi:hypothetical protein
MNLNTWWTAFGALVGRLVALFASFASVSSTLGRPAFWPALAHSLAPSVKSHRLLAIAPCLTCVATHTVDEDPIFTQQIENWQHNLSSVTAVRKDNRACLASEIDVNED